MKDWPNYQDPKVLETYNTYELRRQIECLKKQISILCELVPSGGLEVRMNELLKNGFISPDKEGCSEE